MLFFLPTHRIWRLPAAPQKHHCFQTGVLITKGNEVNKRPVLGDFYPWASDYYRENQFTAMMGDIKRKRHKTNDLFKNGWLKWKLKYLTIYGSSEFSNICRLIWLKHIFYCSIFYTSMIVFDFFLIVTHISFIAVTRKRSKCNEHECEELPIRRDNVELNTLKDREDNSLKTEDESLKTSLLSNSNE